MAGKYHYISALAEMTAADIVKNENEWTRFLTTAARLYKYPFNEQMLIYAQRSDATACASLETWNEKMNCWVNRGAKGIALIDSEAVNPFSSPFLIQRYSFSVLYCHVPFSFSGRTVRRMCAWGL